MTAEDLWKVKRVGPPSVSPDGRWCVVEVTSWNIDNDDSSSNLWLLSTDGKTQKQLTYTTGKNNGPRWSPDGKSIAFTSQRAGDDVSQIYVISLTGGEARRVSNGRSRRADSKWAADSRTIYSIGWTWPDAADDTAHEAREKARRSPRARPSSSTTPSTASGTKWIADGKRPMIFATDVDSGHHRNLLAKSKRFLPPTEPPPSANDYDVAPDGKELCFVSDSTNDYGLDFNSDLYTLNLNDDASPKNITQDNAAKDTNPVYSPDGEAPCVPAANDQALLRRPPATHGA